jgi:enterochelin esterase family protein
MMRFLVTMLFALGIPCMGAADDYALGPDSKPQYGVPQGTVTKHLWTTSEIYPDTETDYWVYVPSQYTDKQPAAVMVFQDGHDYVETDGSVRAPTVMDNLIHRGEMPVTIGVFINPSKKEVTYDQRDKQYLPINDTYARFVLEEILPEVGKDYTLVDDASGRAIAGMSDGGLVAFTVGWHRPDAFSKVISHIGSYTRLRGGSEYPYLIRKTRGDPKPIRVFLQDGSNDLNLVEGNWTLANLSMASALMFARYDYRFEMGTGGHDLKHGGAIFPDTLRWIWRDYPGVKAQPVDLSMVVGEWDVQSNYFGYITESRLTITVDDGKLVATILDPIDGELEVTDISFEDDMLTYEYAVPPSQLTWGSKDPKGTPGIMQAWSRVSANTFSGALSRTTATEVSEFDYSITGQRISPEE